MKRQGTFWQHPWEEEIVRFIRQFVMAEINQGVQVDSEMKSRKNGHFTDVSPEARLAGNSERSKFAIRTQMEKILLVVAGILFVLCIVFIALFAKESSGDDDSSSSSSGRSGKWSCSLVAMFCISV